MTKNDIKHFDLSSIESIQDLKRQYKDLIKKNHPDVGGDLQKMVEINNEYDYLFAQVKIDSKWKKDQSAKVDDGFRDILVKIIHIPDISIEICGTWVWVGGNTKSCKSILKDAGFHYAAKKQMWYWHSPEENVVKRRSHTPMEKIREIYGSMHIDNDPLRPITD